MLSRILIRCLLVTSNYPVVTSTYSSFSWLCLLDTSTFSTDEVKNPAECECVPEPCALLTASVKLFAAGHVEDLGIDCHEDARVLHAVVLAQLLQGEVASPHLGKRRGLAALARVRARPPPPPRVNHVTRGQQEHQNAEIEQHAAYTETGPRIQLLRRALPAASVRRCTPTVPIVRHTATIALSHRARPPSCHSGALLIGCLSPEHRVGSWDL